MRDIIYINKKNKIKMTKTKDIHIVAPQDH